jgi:phage terminase large subunit GpA-like protein
MVVEESSPGRMILVDEDWKPQTVHEVEPCGGIFADYMLGTRGAFYWFCPHCGDPFRPEFSRLKWDAKASAGESAKTAEMICPNGCCIAPDRKFECNQAGVWLHETADGKSVCELRDSNIRDTDIVSYRCEGPIAAMQSWEQMVSRYLQAKETFETTQDDQALKSTINLDQGKAYRPLVRSIGDVVSEETLKALSDGHPVGMAPDWVRFITIQVDIQKTFFAVQADAWGAGLERRMIDRFDIATPPETAPGGARDEAGNAQRTLDPARYFEDWVVLEPLLEKVYSVGATGLGMMPVAMIIDSAGRPGVTPNAYRFLRKMQRAGKGNRVYLSKGDPRMQDRAKYTAPDKVLQQKTRHVSDIKLVFVNTDKLKDEVMLSLTRKDPGPGKYHLSEKLPARVFSELSAEVRTDAGWQKRRSGIANETFDLAVYGKALAIVLKAETINWELPPSWARPVEENIFAVRREEGSDKTELVHKVQPRVRRVRSRGI